MTYAFDRKALELAREVQASIDSAVDFPMPDVRRLAIIQTAIVAGMHWAAEAASRLQAPAVAEDGWQPIETAPQDGTLIDLWARRETTGEYERHPDCSWGLRVFGSEQYGDPTWLGLPDRYSAVTPTHWMRPPAAPSLRTGGPE